LCFGSDIAVKCIDENTPRLESKVVVGARIESNRYNRPFKHYSGARRWAERKGDDTKNDVVESIGKR